MARLFPKAFDSLKLSTIKKVCITNNRYRRCFLTQLTLLTLVFCWAGCGSKHTPTYPVSGKVVFEDGTPLGSGGTVLFESMATENNLRLNARGRIQPDDTFEMTTFEDGDGAVVGKHRVLVRAQRDSREYLESGIAPRPVIDERFEHYKTSGLEFTVEQGNNEYKIVVRRPTQTPRRP